MADVASLKLKVDSSGANAGIMNFERGMDKVTRSAKRAMLAIAAYVGVSIKAFSSFEEQMDKVSTMLDQQTMKHMPAYAKAIKGMAIEFGEGTATLTQGLYNVLSASVPAEHAIKALDVVVKTSKAGYTDTATAAYALTGVMNAYGLSIDKIGRVSDVLFSIQQKGQTEFGKFAPVIGKLTSITSGAGISLEEVAAALSTITRSGISTEESITYLKGAVFALQGQTKEAVTIAKEHGIELSVEALRADELGGMIKKLSVLSGETIKNIFKEKEARTVISKLIQDQTGFLSDYEYALNSTGIRQEAFEKAVDNLATRFRRLWQMIKIVSVEVGEEFAGQMTELTEYILEHKDKIIKAAETAADKLSGFIDFMRNDWRAGIKLGLDVSLELFRGFGKSLMIVLEDIFLPLGSNISIWVKRGIAQGLEHRRLTNEFLNQMEYSGGITKEAEDAIRARAAQRASEKLSTGYFQPVLEEAYPSVIYEPDTKRLKQAVQETKAEIQKLYSESGFGDHTNRTPFEQLAIDADKWLDKMPEIEIATQGYGESIKGVTNATSESGEKATEVWGLLEVYNMRLQEEMENTSLYISERFADTAHRIEGSMSNAFSSMISDGASFKDAMNGFFRDVGRAFGQMASEMMARAIMLKTVGALSGSVFSSSMPAPTAWPGQTAATSALGNVFSNGRIVPMADGAILNSPTYFPLADGKTGVAGEAGPELGFFPLSRGRGGRLGIEGSGGSPNVTVNPTPVKIVFVRNDREAQLEAMRSEEGQSEVINTVLNSGLY